MEIIKTENGNISGTVAGESGKEVSVYRGIPYATPPVGDLRWKPPQPMKAWSGVLECINFRPVAPQLGGPSSSMEQSEDCLYLNIVTPAKKASEKLPVMVWFHGGGLDNGSGTESVFNGHRFPHHGRIVLVTVNQRLGPLGLLAHPQLSAEDPNGLSGNYLFLDLIASLKWVRKNIGAFGGDPGNVTIFGESGGGNKVHCLLASPLAKGLFSKAICESGFDDPRLFRDKSLEDAEALGEKLFDKLGVKTLKQARSLSYQEVVKATNALSEELKGNTQANLWNLWTATIDGTFLLDTPMKTVTVGKHNAVPMILGANLGELIPGFFSVPHTIPAYVDMLSGNNQAGSWGYAYIFDQVPAGWRAQGGKAIHGIELPYVFGDYDNSAPFNWGIALELESTFGVTSKDPGLTSVDKKVSMNMMAMWSQFARTGDPSVAGIIDWPAWQPSTDQYLYVTESLKVKSGFTTVV